MDSFSINCYFLYNYTYCFKKAVLNDFDVVNDLPTLNKIILDLFCIITI